MVESILWNVALPAVCVSAGLVCFWWPLKSGGRWWSRGLVVIALMLGLVGSFLVDRGIPAWPVVQAWQGLVWLALLLALMGWCDVYVGSHAWAARVLLASLTGLVACWIMSLPDVTPLLFALVVGTGVFLGGMFDSGPQRGIPMLVGVAAAATALSLATLMANSITVSLMSASLAASSVATLVVAILLMGRKVCDIGGGGAACGGLLFALALTSWTYDYDMVPDWTWLLAL